MARRVLPWWQVPSLRSFSLGTMLLGACGRAPGGAGGDAGTANDAARTESQGDSFAADAVPDGAADAGTEALALPLAYVQSAFASGDPATYAKDTPGYGGVLGAVAFKYADKKLWAEALATLFDGAEVLTTNLDSPGGRTDIRDLSRAFREVSAALGRPFWGYFDFARPPGFSFPSDWKAQPADWRSLALKSDGTPWQRVPPPISGVGSVIGHSGNLFDVSNAAAASAFVARLRSAFRASCTPETECLGPIHGFMVWNETKLSETYAPFETSPDEDLHDIVPIAAGETDVHKKYPRLRYGHPFDLMVDGDPYFSFSNPPKRGIPLFSEGAGKSFAAWAAAHGHPELTKLPADRGEFNDDDATLSPLPAWVAFVPTTDAVHWGIWRDWVYDTWTGFLERYAQAVVEAQAGNPDFKGVLQFQLPSWYSLRASAATPLTFEWIDSKGTAHTDTLTLADEPDYPSLHPVVMGIDVERLLASPWVAGFIHETTNYVPGLPVPAGATQAAAEDVFFDSPRARTLFLAGGARVRELARKNGKLFGAFARSQGFSSGAPNAGVLAPALFTTAWSRTMDLLAPDIVSTISPYFYFSTKSLAAPYWPFVTGNDGSLHDAWLASYGPYRSAYRK